MKGKNWMIVITLILVVMLAGCSSASTELSDQFDEETVKAEAMKSIDLFNSKDYQGIIDMGSDEMKESITADEFKKQSDPYLDKNGSFKEIVKTVVLGSENKKTNESYGGVVMIGKYENGKIQFTIGFDEEMKLIQFQIK
ncbi:MAG: DUF3887 domain-containing protein [Hespellia sp.]|nr:DUF3887 domain-containing protein [Hespellia sp.]